MCTKSANCVLGNPDVFDTSRKPWILPDNDKTGNVKEVIDRCPSEALLYIERESSNFLFEEGRFYLNDVDGRMIAEITYTNAGEKIIIIDHTFVYPVLRGQGIAAKLIDSVVKLAIDQGKKIVPLCPYDKKLFDENEGYDKKRH